eukprot:COSAG02_NODE_2201_length_9535_cov_20.999364_10_plen_142_part_00
MSSVDKPLAGDKHLRVARRAPSVVDPFRRTGGDVLVERNVVLDQRLLHRCLERLRWSIRPFALDKRLETEDEAHPPPVGIRVLTIRHIRKGRAEEAIGRHGLQNLGNRRVPKVANECDALRQPQRFVGSKAVMGSSETDPP